MTYTYKVGGPCEVRADVYTRPGSGPRPVILWLHGGALIFGNRRMIAAAQVELYLDAGFTVVAADYRLAPETRLPEILTDIQDAVGWIRTEGPRLFGIDTERLAVVGHSAGGYLSLLAGCFVRPRPRALVAFYGYGDIAGPWYSTPSPFYCQQPLVREQEARSVVGASPISAWPPTESAEGAATRDRGRFYLYCRQQGRWPQEVAGLDPREDRDALSPFCPVELVTADYPPTMLLHGDADTDVPYEQSLMMARALNEARVPHRLLTIADGEHVFDVRMGDPVVAAAFADALAFLMEHV